MQGFVSCNGYGFNEPVVLVFVVDNHVIGNIGDTWGNNFCRVPISPFFDYVISDVTFFRSIPRKDYPCGFRCGFFSPEIGYIQRINHCNKVIACNTAFISGNSHGLHHVGSGIVGGNVDSN